MAVGSGNVEISITDLLEIRRKLKYRYKILGDSIEHFRNIEPEYVNPLKEMQEEYSERIKKIDSLIDRIKITLDPALVSDIKLLEKDIPGLK